MEDLESMRLLERLEDRENMRLLRERAASDPVRHAKGYKIKLRKAGYCLVYRMEEDIVFVTVIAGGKGDKRNVYAAA